MSLILIIFKLKSKVTIVHKDKHVRDGPRYRSAPVNYIAKHLETAVSELWLIAIVEMLRIL